MTVAIKYSSKSSEQWKSQLIETLYDNVRKNEFWDSYYEKTTKFSSINIHLGIFIEPYLQLISKNTQTISISRHWYLLIKRQSHGRIWSFCLTGSIHGKTTFGI